ncbi:MAG TPA: hypothetical protein VFJ93_03660 [Gaiellaceae bacterium]|nr:hypothetical protein [Gaiellaceae bacterium]
MKGPWARAFVNALGIGHQEVPDTVSELRIESSLITARVAGRPVTLSAHPIPPGVWAAIAAQVTPDQQSLELAQLLEHTWDEPLVPDELVRVGSEEDVAAVAGAVAEEIERDPSTLLRFRGYATRPADDDGAWRGGELPPLPSPARRPPDSVPKRFGASGIQTADGELVEVLVRAYRAFAD